MMFCKNCGNQMGDNAQICESCGTVRGVVIRVESNSFPPNDPDRGVKFIGFDEKVPQRGSWHLRNWILGILLALIIIGLNKCTEMSGQRMNRQSTAPASADAVNITTELKYCTSSLVFLPPCRLSKSLK